MSEDYTLEPTGFACPTCGSMAVEHTVTLLKAAALSGTCSRPKPAGAQFTMVESQLGACLGTLNERAELRRQRAKPAPPLVRMARPMTQRSEALERAMVIKSLLESEWVERGAAMAGN